MFGDFASIPLIIFTFSYCVIIDILVRNVGLKLKIWAIDPDVEYKEENKTDLDKDF